MAREFGKKFYKTKTWQKKRAEILQRDNYECQLCKAKGKYTKGKVVHHIKHLKDRPDLALTDSNLLSVCASCHEKLHPEKFQNIFKKKKPITEEKW